MNFDPVAFAMGKAGASRDLVSALMGGSGGGGVPGSLEECGWVSQKNGKATVTGNVADMPTGSSSTNIYIMPTTDIQASRWYQANDELVLAVKVTALSKRLSIGVDDNSRATGTSKNGLFSFTNANGYATQTGEDVLTFKFTGTVKKFFFYPATNTGGTGSTVSATLEVTGMQFNGTVIYGKV